MTLVRYRLLLWVHMRCKLGDGCCYFGLFVKQFEKNVEVSFWLYSLVLLSVAYFGGIKLYERPEVYLRARY